VTPQYVTFSITHTPSSTSPTVQALALLLAPRRRQAPHKRLRSNKPEQSSRTQASTTHFPRHRTVLIVMQRPSSLHCPPQNASKRTQNEITANHHRHSMQGHRSGAPSNQRLSLPRYSHSMCPPAEHRPQPTQRSNRKTPHWIISDDCSDNSIQLILCWEQEVSPSNTKQTTKIRSAVRRRTLKPTKVTLPHAD
jgi:hypothetical protein